LYYACDSGVPQPECAISVWGYRDGRLAVKEKVTFPAIESGHESQDFVMNSTTFDWRWRFIDSIGFSIARADNGESMFGGLMLDAVSYTVNTGCA
jgi:hypothetical protein